MTAPQDEAASPAHPPIRHDATAKGGRYWASFGEGEEEAEMTYVVSGAMIIDHTYAPPAARGTGVAARMVAQAVEDARARGLKVRPLCTYAAAQFRRHPEWSDLLA